MNDRKPANAYPWATRAEGHYVGTVDAVGFTHGGMGNQWTVIDGQRFVTYWDARTTDWREGDTVRYTVAYRKFGWDNYGTPPPAAHAQAIHRVERDEKDPARWVLAPREKADA